MIATGNHNFERFAALCNTPEGSQELRRFWQVPFNKALCCMSFGSPGWRPLRLAVLNQKCVPSNEIHPLSQPVRAASSPRGGAKCGFAAGGRLRASPTVGAAKTRSTYHYRSTLPQPRFARQLPQRGSRGGYAAGGRLRASPTVGAAKIRSTYHYRSTLPQLRFARQLPQRGSQGCFAPGGGGGRCENQEAGVMPQI